MHENQLLTRLLPVAMCGCVFANVAAARDGVKKRAAVVHPVKER